MGIRNFIKKLTDNYELKQDNDYLQIRVKVLEEELDERNKKYRGVVGDKELYKEKSLLLDSALYRANKILDDILEIAEQNNYKRNDIKIKKIVELAKNRNTTSST